MASPETIHSLAVAHAIALSRYSSGEVRKILALLHRTEESVLERLRKADPDSAKGARLQELLDDLQAIQKEGWALIEARLNGSVDELAAAEAEFARRLVGAGQEVRATLGPTPSPAQLIAAVRARPFQGRLLSEWLQHQDETVAARVRDTVRQGFVEGRPTADIVRELTGTRAAEYKDGVLAGSRRGVETLVRTSLTHTANVAAQTTYGGLGVERYQYVATLDQATTILCGSLHGQTFPVGSGPMPPRHPGCRSTTIPVVGAIKGIKQLELPSYEAWLRRQSRAVQEDVLGVTKARLFRDGKLPLTRFVDRRERVLSLSELRRADAGAFEAAGL